jgi:hypothetical protein
MSSEPTGSGLPARREDSPAAQQREARDRAAEAQGRQPEQTAAEPQASERREPAQPHERNPAGEARRPPGGAGRREDVRGSGIHPLSAGTAPPDAVIRAPGDLGQGAGGEEGGRSGVHYSEDELEAIEQAAREGHLGAERERALERERQAHERTGPTDQR